MADDTDAGLPVRQLLKMVASGDLSPAEFKQLTKHVIGPTHGAVRRNTVCHWCFFSLLCRQYSNILAIYLEGFEPIEYSIKPYQF